MNRRCGAGRRRRYDQRVRREKFFVRLDVMTKMTKRCETARLYRLRSGRQRERCDQKTKKASFFHFEILKTAVFAERAAKTFPPLQATDNDLQDSKLKQGTGEVSTSEERLGEPVWNRA